MKPIIIHDKDTDYTLEFNRDSIRFAEQRGFSIEDVDRYPMTKIPELFYYAFRMHHKNIARDKTDKIFDELGGLSTEFLKRLGELYAEPFNTLVTEDEQPKNSKLTVEL